MNAPIYFLYLITMSFVSCLYAERELVDRTLVIIYCNQGQPEENTAAQAKVSSVILLSDLKPGIDGAARSVEQMIMHRLMLADAEKLKISESVKDSDIDRYLAKIQEMHKVTLEEIKQEFERMGITLEEGRKEIRDILILDTLRDYRIKAKSLVSKQDIEDYYVNNPIEQPAEYTISQSLIPFDGTPNLTRAKVKQDIESGDILRTATWNPPIALKDDEISADKSYIKDLQPGAVIILQENEEGLLLLQLVTKKSAGTLSLEERRKDIAQTLGAERSMKAMKEYQDELRKNARIRYMDESYKPS